MGLIPNHREVFEVGGRNYYTLEEARRKAESDREAILARKVRTNLGVVSALDAIFLARAAEIPSEDSSGRGFGVVDYHSNVETGREITGISFRFPDRKTAIATLNERILEIGEKKKELDEEGNDWNRTEVDVLNNHQQFLIDAVETFSRMEDDVKS